MNRQNPGIEWTHPWGRPGYTWNVQSGCLADCQWHMGEHTVAECYAKTVAERLAQKAYPQGFAHSYWNISRLEEPHAQSIPSGIFADSMSDLLGHWVTQEHIEMVLDVMWETPRHIYFLLTKNAPRISTIKEWPPNLWMGISVPADYMYGKKLNEMQQNRMFEVGLEHLLNSNAVLKWVSFEPLSRPWHHLMERYKLDWAVIGAATSGRNKYQPAPWDRRLLEKRLDQNGTPIFHKGNISEPRRLEYPDRRLYEQGV